MGFRREAAGVQKAQLFEEVVYPSLNSMAGEQFHSSWRVSLCLPKADDHKLVPEIPMALFPANISNVP